MTSMTALGRSGTLESPARDAGSALGYIGTQGPNKFEHRAGIIASSQSPFPLLALAGNNPDGVTPP